MDKEEVPTLAPIDIGDSLPSFTLKNEKDEDVDVSSLTAEKGLVLFLAPKASTRKLHLPAHAPLYRANSLLSWVHYSSLWFPRRLPRFHLFELRGILLDQRHYCSPAKMADEGKCSPSPFKPCHGTNSPLERIALPSSFGSKESSD